MPFEVPEGWVWTIVGEVGEVITGSTPSKDIAEYYGGDIPFYKPTDLDLGINTNSASDTLTIEGYNLSRKLPVGSILVTCIGATIGKTGLISTEGACNQQINAIIPSSLITSTFLYYSCISEYFQKEIRNHASATTLPILNKNNFTKLLIPLPPLSEQQRIVKDIERWFALIEQIEQSKADLQTTIKQAKSKILDLAIHGKLVPQDPNDEPAIELLKRINPDFTPCDNGHYTFDVPNGWNWCKLNDLCSFLSRGKSPKYSEDDKTYPVFAQKCNLKEGGISLEQARFLDPSTINKWDSKYKLQTGDVLVNSTGTGTVGRTRLFDESYLGKYPFVVPDSHVAVVRTYEEINSEYVFAYMSSQLIQQYIEDNLAGSTNQKELYIGVLENLYFPFPPINEQQRIVQKIEELFSVLDNIQNALEV